MANFSGIAVLITSDGRPVDIEWAMSLPTYQYPIGMSVAWFLAKGKSRGLQRDALVEKALQIGAEYMIFVDDDTVIPNYAIQQLHYRLSQDPQAGICGGIYCTKTSTPEPIVFKEQGGGPFWGWRLGEVFECKGLGTGCMMIKSSIFKDIPKPWFVDFCDAPVGETLDYNGITVERAKNTGTDDLYFCKKVTEAGYKILAHGGVLPVHIGQDGKQYSLPLDSYPCKEYAKEIGEALKTGQTKLVFEAPDDSTGSSGS